MPAPLPGIYQSHETQTVVSEWDEDLNGDEENHPTAAPAGNVTSEKAYIKNALAAVHGSSYQESFMSSTEGCELAVARSARRRNHQTR